MLLLTACSVMPEPMTPEQARAYGVQVEDGAVITGTVVSSEFKTLAGVEDRCGEGSQGCTVAVEGGFPSPSHKYRLYYAEHKCNPFHEAAHAMYETWDHTTAFELRIMQGDRLAACPM